MIYDHLFMHVQWLSRDSSQGCRNSHMFCLDHKRDLQGSLKSSSHLEYRNYGWIEEKCRFIVNGRHKHPSIDTTQFEFSQFLTKVDLWSFDLCDKLFFLWDCQIYYDLGNFGGTLFYGY